MTRIDAASHTFYYNFLRKGTSPTKRGADLAQRSGNGIALIRIGLLDLVSAKELLPYDALRKGDVGAVRFLEFRCHGNFPFQIGRADV